MYGGHSRSKARSGVTTCMYVLPGAWKNYTYEQKQKCGSEFLDYNNE